MKLAIVGRGRSGKDEAANWFHEHTSLIYSFSTSWVIAPYAARELGMSVESAFACRHEHRAIWRRIGDELRVSDPAFLAREVLSSGDLLVGVRSRGEIETAINEGLVGLVIWIERSVPEDPTLEFGPDSADVIIENNSSIARLHARLGRLAGAMGILRSPTP